MKKLLTQLFFVALLVVGGAVGASAQKKPKPPKPKPPVIKPKPKPPKPKPKPKPGISKFASASLRAKID